MAVYSFVDLVHLSKQVSFVNLLIAVVNRLNLHLFLRLLDYRLIIFHAGKQSTPNLGSIKVMLD